jgi:hypothetical protein
MFQCDKNMYQVMAPSGARAEYSSSVSKRTRARKTATTITSYSKLIPDLSVCSGSLHGVRLAFQFSVEYECRTFPEHKRFVELVCRLVLHFRRDPDFLASSADPDRKQLPQEERSNNTLAKATLGNRQIVDV